MSNPGRGGRRRNAAGLSLVFLFALVLASGGSAQRLGSYGGTLTVGIARGAPDFLDPTFSRAGEADTVLRTICEGLYDVNNQLHIVPWLAARMPIISKDKLTYTIDLRRGVEFNDGTPFDAQAVVTSLERDIQLPGSARAASLSAVQSVTTAGPYTVVIHLSRPFTPLTDVLTGFAGIIMSPTQLASLGTNFTSDPIGVGPFMYDNSVAGSSITVIKSPFFYNQAAVHLGKIVFTIETDAATAAGNLMAGDIQVLDAIGAPLLPAVQQDSAVRVLQQTTIGNESIIINIGNKNGVGNPPYANVGTALASSPDLRKAFEEAIDRNALAKLLSPTALPGCTPIAPSSPWYDATVACTPYDPADARRLVTASGVDPTVQLLATNDTGTQLLAQYLQAAEAAVGINVAIVTVDLPAALSQVVGGHFDAYVVGNQGDIDPDVFLLNRCGTSGAINYSGYSNPTLDLILQNAFKATTRKALVTLYHAAQVILLGDRPVIYLYHPIRFAGVSTNVEGVHLVNVQIRVAFAQYVAQR